MKMNPEVDEYLLKKGHPMTAEIQKVREIIISADDRIEETIKWSCPTFTYKGNMASFFMNAKKFVSLMFHFGASMPNRSGLLQGEGRQGRTARFDNMDDIDLKKQALQELVREWIAMQDAEDQP